MNIMITKDNCKFCDMAKIMLKDADIDFRIYDLNTNEGQFLLYVFDFDTVPFAIIDGFVFRNTAEIKHYIEQWKGE